MTMQHSENQQRINWQYYLQNGEVSNSEWFKLMQENIDELYDLDSKANESARLLETKMVISHRDLDSKNVMWSNDNPVVIDWEGAGYVNPMVDLIDTAVYWSVNEDGAIDKAKFMAFIEAYKNRYIDKSEILQANWKTALIKGYAGRLSWLEYSLKRSLGIECADEQEQRLGTGQVTDTIYGIKRYSDLLPELENWLVSMN